MRWTRAKTNFVLDSVIALTFLGEAISGFILWLVLPSGGYQGGRGADTLRVFIFEREAWKDLHSWLAITMVAGVVLHVALHWNWIVGMARKMWKDAFHARQEPGDGGARVPVVNIIEPRLPKSANGQHRKTSEVSSRHA